MDVYNLIAEYWQKEIGPLLYGFFKLNNKSIESFTTYEQILTLAIVMNGMLILSLSYLIPIPIRKCDLMGFLDDIDVLILRL